MVGTWGTAGVRCKIKQGREGAGRTGEALCYFEHSKIGQRWLLVLWDDEDDPDCFKAAGLRIMREPWQSNAQWEDAVKEGQ